MYTAKYNDTLDTPAIVKRDEDEKIDSRSKTVDLLGPFNGVE